MIVRNFIGFTRIEVLIAISIIAISLSIVYGLYSSIVSVAQNVEDRISLNDTVQVAFTRFNRDLSGLYRGELGYLTSRDSTDPSEDEPILEFISSAHLSFNPDAAPSPLSVIRYYLEPNDEDDTYYLLRSDTPVAVVIDKEDVREARKFRVCEGLLEVRLQYLDQEGDELSEWNTKDGSEEEQEQDSRFPRLVAIEFVFPSGITVEEEGAVYSTAVLLRPGVLEFAEGIGG